MAKNVPGHFIRRLTVEHSSGYKFQQRGSRVYIENDEGVEVDSITSNKLQSATSWEPVILTASQLENLAKIWLADNL